MIPSDVVQSPGDVMRRLNDLERKVRELEGARRLEAATIGAGGITIKGGSIRVVDEDDVLQVQAGLLPDGTYGLAAADPSGTLVALSTLAFGMQSAKQTGSILLSTAGTFVVDPSSLAVRNVRIGTARRALVILSAKIGHSLDTITLGTRTGAMCLRVKRVATGTQTLSPNNGEYSVSADVGGNTSNAQVPHLPGTWRNSAVMLVEGSSIFPAANEDYDFEAYYFTASGQIDFSSRVVTVMPF